MKTFCPSCERETNCVYVAELYECKECGCDFESRQRLMQERAEAAEAEAAALRSRLDLCEDALISMVQQFFYSAEGSNCFSHAFMSAEEEAASYLVGNGIAHWTNEHKNAICFTEVDDAR